VKWQIQLHVCGQIIYVCNSEKIIKIGQYLRKLCSDEKGSSCFDSQCKMAGAIVNDLFFFQVTTQLQYIEDSEPLVDAGYVIDGVLCSEQQKQTKGATKLSN